MTYFLIYCILIIRATRNCFVTIKGKRCGRLPLFIIKEGKSMKNKKLQNYLEQIIMLCNQFGGFMLSLKELTLYVNEPIEVEQILGYFRNRLLSVTARATVLPKPLDNFDIVIDIKKVLK